MGKGDLKGPFALHPSTDYVGNKTWFLARNGMVVSHGVHLPNAFSKMLRAGRKVIVSGVYASYILADDAYEVDVKVGIG